MRVFLLASIVLVVPGWAGTTLAQEGKGIAYGWAEKIVHVRDLPPDVREKLRKETGAYLAVGFRYRHWFLFGPGFDFWTWDGRYVLYQGDRYFALSDEQFEQLLGKEEIVSLGKPLAYRFPIGLVTALVIVGAGCVAIYMSAPVRAGRLMKDSRYQEALQLYAQSLPSDSEPNQEDIENGLTRGADFLQQAHGIRGRKAKSALRLLVKGLERERSYGLRNQALEHEEAGEWEAAIDHYGKAARVQQKWDQKDYEFLLTCIQRVRAKQARSNKA
jgi:tetratricopeptide (TPR) repeat protein